MQANGDNAHCLQWWLKIHKQCPLLFKMVTSILSNFNAPKVESSFSIMGDVVDKKCWRMNMETYSGIQTIKYFLEANHSAKQVSLLNSFFKFNSYISHVTSWHTVSHNQRTGKKLLVSNLYHCPLALPTIN